MKSKRKASGMGPVPDRLGSKKQKKFPIVGIGASAGGLEACSALLKALPNNLGMAYVLLPHLDPSRESAFSEILSRTTKMKVLEATDHTRVEPNRVYVIAPNCEMTIADGMLHLTSAAEPRAVRATVDRFLRSLAGDQGNQAIGVILSGTGSDGAIGLAAIKGEGGITFAQDSTAKYDGMPASAIAGGWVDMVLPPQGIAEELKRIAQHPYLLSTVPTDHAGYTRMEQMGQVFGILRRATRVDFSEYKLPTIGRRVARRMALHKIEDLVEYVAVLRRDRAEVAALYQDLLINVTSFFRDRDAFDALRTVVYPELVKRRDNAAIRIWVPGCATGEESYSHAIALNEYLSEHRAEAAVQIFGTDLSESGIHRARVGVYKESIADDISPARLKRYFHKVEGGYQITKAVRDQCIFSLQNVFNDPPFSRVDLISCRNVMIYLSQSLQKRVIPVFHYALNPDGFLMIGNTEGLVGPGSELFEIAERKQKIYRKRPVPSPIASGFSVRVSEPLLPTLNADAKPVASGRMSTDLQRESDRLLLAHYAPPSVVVNDQLEVVQTRGHTGPFLELPPGKVTTNVLKMARPGLLFELQNAIEEAKKSGGEVVRPDVAVEGNGSPRRLTLRVTPFKSPAQQKHCFLVAFEPPSESRVKPTDTVPRALADDERSVKDKQIAQLKQELAATKEYLQSIIEAMDATNEELQSANEEIQSGNEELQSTNEELQTSKEELESANEELHTVNEEMQHRNEQLYQANNDLNNLLNRVNLPMVIVGPELNIRRYTPLAGNVLGLTDSDVGRPIARLRLKMLDGADLEQFMLDVITERRPAHRQLQDAKGRACELRVTPYWTSDNRIDGVILSLLMQDNPSPYSGEMTQDSPLPPKKTKKAKAKSAVKKPVSIRRK